MFQRGGCFIRCPGTGWAGGFWGLGGVVFWGVVWASGACIRLWGSRFGVLCVSVGWVMLGVSQLIAGLGLTSRCARSLAGGFFRCEELVMSVVSVNGVGVAEGASGGGVVQSGVFPVDGSFVSVTSDSGVVLGHLVVAQAAREVAAGGESGVRVPVAVVLDPRASYVGGESAVWFGCVAVGAVRAGDEPYSLAGWSVMRAGVLTALAAQAEAAQVREEVVRVGREHRVWVDRLVESAHVWADENSLCSRFDDFMSEQGLATRAADYAVYVDVRLECRVRVDVSARDDDDAMQRVDDEDVRSALADRLGSSTLVELEVSDWDADSAERE